MKYSTQTIQKACRMYKAAVSLRKIQKVTGIKSHSVIYFHCDPAKRSANLRRTAKWRDEHPERVRAINKRAAKKFKKKHGRN